MPPAPGAAIRPIPGGVRIAVRAQPRASREAIAGVVDDGHGGAALKVAVHAPPVEGEANLAVARVIAAALGVPARAVTIARGETGRDKLVDVRGIAYDEALRVLELLLQSPRR